MVQRAPVRLKLKSRLTVVSHEAKKEQIELPKIKFATNYCVSFTWASVFIIWHHNHNQYLFELCQLLNLHCRYTTFLPTLTNTRKIKSISEVVCCSQHCPSRGISFYLFFLNGSTVLLSQLSHFFKNCTIVGFIDVKWGYVFSLKVIDFESGY